MRRYIDTPPVAAKVTATFDDVLGYPTKYYVEKIGIEDNDEGFEITGFKVKG